MAALYGNISKNEGQTWSSWAENIGYQSPESVDENDEDDEANDLKKKEGDALQLKKEDMRLFGFCPAWDDFFLVVCELCGLIVKPQALKSHLEIRHGKDSLDNFDQVSPTAVTHSETCLVKANSALSSHTVLVPNKSSSHINMKSSTGHSVSRLKLLGAIGMDGKPSKVKQEKNTVTPKIQKNHTLAPVVRVERISDNFMNKNKNPASPDRKDHPLPLSSSALGATSLFLSPLPGPGPGPVQNQHHVVVKSIPMGSSSPKSSAEQRIIKKASSKNKKVPRERKLLPCKDREYDPDKHCGVIVPESGKPCTRSLTCKTHSLSLRRKVLGRKKNFDDLLADHRALKEAALKASQAAAVSSMCDVRNSHSTLTNATAERQSQSFSPLVTNNSLVVSSIPTFKDNLGSIKSLSLNSNLQRPASAPQSKSPKAHCNKMVSHSILQNRSSTVMSSFPGRPSSTTFLCNQEEVKPANQGKLGDTKSSVPDVPFIRHHPRPSAVCTFGLRQLGNGMFLLDRRWDLQRAAFRAAVCTERSGHPPPLKKLCVESRLPPVPEPTDPNDPYYFTCPDASSSPSPSGLSVNSTNNAFVTTLSLTFPHSVAFTTVAKTTSPKLSTSNSTHRPMKSKLGVSKAVKMKDSKPTLLGSNAHSTLAGNAAKKKEHGETFSRLNVLNNKNVRSMALPTVHSSVGSVTVNAGSTFPLSFPFSLGENFGTLSRIQAASPPTSGRNSFMASSSGFTSQSSSLHSTVTSSSARKEGSIMVTGVDIINGQIPVTNALLHSVTVGRFAGSGPKLLATPGGGLGITLGGAGLIGQLSQIQNLHETSISDHLGLVNSQSIGSQKRTSSSGGSRAISTNSSSSSAKSRTKNRKSSLCKSVASTATSTNHTAVSQPMGVGLLIKGTSGGGFFATLGELGSTSGNHAVSVTSSVNSRPESSCRVSVHTASLPNGLRPCPPNILQTAVTTVDVSGLVNHAISSSSPAFARDHGATIGSKTCKGKSPNKQSTAFSKNLSLHSLITSSIALPKLPLVSTTSRADPSHTKTYQQVFATQMLSSSELNQLHLPSPARQGCSLKTPTIAFPLKLPLLSSSGITATITSASQQQALVKGEEHRRSDSQTQGSQSFPT